MTSTANELRRVNYSITWLSILGFVLCYYVHVVKTAKESNPSYKPICDINEHVSCTKAFMSEYGKGLGLIPKNSILYQPNYLYGLIFYTVIGLISLWNNYYCCTLLISVGVFSNVNSVYLAFILYILKDVCIICVATYIINALILSFSIKKYRLLFRVGGSEKKRK